MCVWPYNTDLLLSSSEPLHLWCVRHDAEPSTFALLKVLLVLDLQEIQKVRDVFLLNPDLNKQTHADTHTQTINSMIPVVCWGDICPFVQLSTGFQQTHSLSKHARTHRAYEDIRYRGMVDIVNMSLLSGFQKQNCLCVNTVFISVSRSVEIRRDMTQWGLTWLCSSLCCLSLRFSGVSATMVNEVLG